MHDQRHVGCVVLPAAVVAVVEHAEVGERRHPQKEVGSAQEQKRNHKSAVLYILQRILCLDATTL